MNFDTARKNFGDAQREAEAANRERGIAQARALDLQNAINNSVFLVGIIDNDQLFHFRILPPNEALLEPSLREYRAFIAEHGDDPEREPEVVSAYYRVAILTRLIGTRAEALEAGRKALELQRSFVDRHLDVPQYRRDLAASYHNVGWLIHVGGTRANSEEALPYLRHARLLREEFVDVQRENLDYLSELAGVLNDIGLAHSILGRYREADDAFAQATQHQDRAFANAPHVRRYRLLLANHLFNRARCQLKLNRFDEAVTMAARLPVLLADDAEAHVRFARVAALTLAARGTVSPGDELLDRAVRALNRAAAADPAVARYWIGHEDLVALGVSPDFVTLRDRLRRDHALRLSSAPRQ
jgi:tetratricopeptide (TPR) repeat protein